MKIGDDERKQIMNFKKAGASVWAIANRYGISATEVEKILRSMEKAEERAEGLSRFDPVYRMKFNIEWERATALVLKGLRRA